MFWKQLVAFRTLCRVVNLYFLCVAFVFQLNSTAHWLMVLVHIVWLCETRKKLYALGDSHGQHCSRCRRQIPLYCPLSGNYFHLICLWFIYCGALRHLLDGGRACCIQTLRVRWKFYFSIVQMKRINGIICCKIVKLLR